MCSLLRSNSTYFESVLNVKVPTMTSNTTPSGVASAQTEYGAAQAAWRAFMGGEISSSSDLGWCSAGSQSSAWLQYEFASACRICCFKLSRNNSATYQFKFSITASNDGTNFDILATDINVTTNGVITSVTSQSDSYKYYRISCTSLVSGTYMSAGSGIKARFYGRQDL